MFRTVLICNKSRVRCSYFMEINGGNVITFLSTFYYLSLIDQIRIVEKLSYPEEKNSYVQKTLLYSVVLDY